MFVTLTLLFVLSLVFSVLLTPLVRKLAFHWKLVDQPDNMRKVHKKPIPRIGGVAVTVAYFASCLLAWGILFWFPVQNAPGFAAVKALVPAVAIVFLVGLADDMLNLQPLHKFAAQGLASVMVVLSGVYIHSISAVSIPRPLGMLVTVVWLMGCTNAVNLIDGLDGLAGGITLLGTATVLVGALISGNAELMVAAAPLAGALIGFLVFNFNPASIFLGDCGSLVLGFLLGCYSLLWMETSTTLVAIAAPLMTLSIPLLDTTLAMARRFLSGRPLFRPDRSHIHHRLLLRGFSHRNAVLCLYGAGATAGVLGLSLLGAQGHWRTLIFATFVCGVFCGIRQLQFLEFQALGRIVLNGGLRSEINAQLAVESAREKLARPGSPDECWKSVQEAGREFGIVPLGMRLAGHTFTAPPKSGLTEPLAVRINVSRDEWIEFGHNMGSAGHLTALVPFARTIRAALSPNALASHSGGEQEAALSATRLHDSRLDRWSGILINNDLSGTQTN
ncbi:MAG: glycosyltransferase family 4 protein [Bryobacteraceae bacterium]